jgi:predicted AAA+ superfamily ATPase
MGSQSDTKMYEYLREDLYENNPWWEISLETGVTADDVFGDLPETKQSDYYIITSDEEYDHIDNPADPIRAHRLYHIIGRIGVGKTTLLKQYIETLIRSNDADYDPLQFLYVPFDTNSLYQLDPPGQLRQVLTYYEGLLPSEHQQYFVFLDDIHSLNRPNEADAVYERLFDLIADRDIYDIHVVATSAVNRPLRRLLETEQPLTPSKTHLVIPGEFTDYLGSAGASTLDALGTSEAAIAGEAKRLKIGEEYGLYQAVRSGDPTAFTEALTEFGATLTDQRRAIKDRLMEYLARGGTLALRMQNDDAPAQSQLQQQLLTETRLSIYREAPKIERIRTISHLEQLLAYVADEGCDSLFQFRDLTELFGVDRRTLQNKYIDTLRQLFLLTPSPEFDNERPRHTRLHIQDTGLLTTLTGHTESDIRTDPKKQTSLAHACAFDHSARLEFNFHTYVDSDTEAYAPWIRHRRMDDAVVDFILKVPGDNETDYLPVGLAYESGTAPAVVDAVDQFCDEYASPFGLVVTSDLAWPGDRSTARSIDGAAAIEIPLWLYLTMA